MNTSFMNYLLIADFLKIPQGNLIIKRHSVEYSLELPDKKKIVIFILGSRGIIFTVKYIFINSGFKKDISYNRSNKNLIFNIGPYSSKGKQGLHYYYKNSQKSRLLTYKDDKRDGPYYVYNSYSKKFVYSCFWKNGIKLKDKYPYGRTFDTEDRD